MNNTYYVAKGTVGYVIYEQGRTLPLPFTWISKSNAEIVCMDFNEVGHRAVSEYYYVHKVTGTRDIAHLLEKGINPYEEWMSKNRDMFKRS